MEPIGMLDHTTIPFMLMAGSPAAVAVNKTRLVEAGITAITTGLMISAAGYYVAFPVLQNQVQNIANKQSEQNAQLLETLREYKREREVLLTKRDVEMARVNAQLLEIQLKLAKSQR